MHRRWTCGIYYSKIIIKSEGINCIHDYLQHSQGRESQHSSLPSAAQVLSVSPHRGPEATPSLVHGLPRKQMRSRSLQGARQTSPAVEQVHRPPLHVPQSQSDTGTSASGLLIGVKKNFSFWINYSIRWLWYLRLYWLMPATALTQREDLCH